MRIYIAGFFDTRERLRPIRDSLWRLGHEVLSTWLDEVAPAAEMDEETFSRKLAFRDLAEIRSADLLLVDTFDETPRGGREVEYGFALGRFQGISIWIVGPYRNVFHRLSDRHFKSWDVCLDALTPVPAATSGYDETQQADTGLTQAEQTQIAAWDAQMRWLEREHYND